LDRNNGKARKGEGGKWIREEHAKRGGSEGWFGPMQEMGEHYPGNGAQPSLEKGKGERDRGRGRDVFPK